VGAGERRLEEKVMRLLNNMQVISEHIDVEMSKLDIHLQVVHLRHPNSKIQNKWVLKAEDKLREGENILAIDCYKQALILQPEFFIPIYNIAVLLEREKMLSYAKSWFELAKEFETDTENVSFGLALVQIKQLQFAAGLREIDEIIQTLEGQKKKVDMTYYYIRALCYKQLGQFDNARKDYEYPSPHLGSSSGTPSHRTTTVCPTSSSQWCSPRAGGTLPSSTASPS
jgi:tetratricopeptide (TPR) repeat protein